MTITSRAVTATRGARLAVRRLGPHDAQRLRHLVDADPYVNVIGAARLDYFARIDRGERGGDYGGEVLGVDGPDGLRAAWWRGATVLPIGGDPELWAELVTYLGQRERNSSSLMGRADTVAALWPALASHWGEARLVRSVQPLLVTDTRPMTPTDSQVRPAVSSDLESYLPAAEAMFAEELGLPPLAGSARRAYRHRVGELIGARRIFVRLDRAGGVAFKAEIGVMSTATSQIQGVWVRPDLRGRGLGTAAMATVIDYALRLTPTVSLYVNDFNHPARRVYERLGMRQLATVATVMF
jgi:predicted GNAT family acetyltransferase